MKKHSKKPKPCLRPSPNEESNLVQAEIDRRRCLRIKQVREQEKAFALKIRQNVKNKRENEIKLLSDQLKEQWKENKLQQQSSLEEKYRENLQELGGSHNAAFADQDAAKKDHRELTREEKKRALERHNKAMLELFLERAKYEQADVERAEARAKAMDIERTRSAQITALPKSTNLILNFDITKLTQGEQKLQPKNVEDFKSTRYHLEPSIQVEREPLNDQVDAREAAQEVGEIINNVIEDAQRSQAEQAEKARLRHKHAMAQLQLQEDHKKLMSELSNLERVDRQRRQEAVAKIPVRIFQPPHKRVEDAEERQRDLEQAFEDMYMLQTGYTGDLTIALEPPAGAGTTPVDSPLLEEERATPPAPEPTVLPAAAMVESSEEEETDVEEENEAGRQEEKNMREHVKETHEKAPVAPKRADPVRRLLGRIQNQREEWKNRQATESADKTSKPSKKQPPVAPSAPARKPEADRTLLHPYEAAKQVRAVTPTEPTSEPDDKQPTTTTVSEQQHLLEQQRLQLQLQEQQLIQQKLEEQLREYHKRLQDLHTPHEDSGLGTGLRPISEGSSGPYTPDTAPVRDEHAAGPGESEITDEPMSEEEHRSEGSAPESGSLSLAEQTAEELETSDTASGVYGDQLYPRMVRIRSSVGVPHTRTSFSPVGEPRVHPPSHYPMVPTGSSSSGTVTSSETSDVNGRTSPWVAQSRDQQAWDQPKSISPGLRPSSKMLQGYSRTSADQVATLQAQSSSEDQEDSVSEELTSSDASLARFSGRTISQALHAQRHEPIDAVLQANRGIGYSRTPPSLDSMGAERATWRSSPHTADRTLSSDVTSTTSKDFTIVTRPESSAAKETHSSLITDTRSASGMSGLATRSPSYLDVYHKKWEEERKLIEAQRQEIRQRQEKQARRMMYYQDVLERHGRISPLVTSDSSQTGTGAGLQRPVTIGRRSGLTSDAKTLGVKRVISSEGSNRAPSPDTLGEFIGRYRESLDLNGRGKENSSAYANVQPFVPSFTGLRASSSNLDERGPGYVPRREASPATSKEQDKANVTSSSTSKKSTSTGEISLPSTGTEYYQFPHSLEESNGVTGGTKSSITTLSELTEMMTRLTSTSGSDSDNGIPQGSSLGPQDAMLRYSQWPRLVDESKPQTIHISGFVSQPEDQRWYIHPKDSHSSIGSIRPRADSELSEMSSTDNVPTSNMDVAQGSTDQRWYIPPKDSHSSIGFIRPRADSEVNEMSQGGIASNTDVVRGSTVQRWFVPPKDSTRSIGSVDHYGSTNTKGDASSADNLFHRNTDLQGSQTRQWFVPSTSSLHSVDSYGHQSVESEAKHPQFIKRGFNPPSSQTQQWFVPQKASTHSVGSIGARPSDQDPSSPSGPTAPYLRGSQGQEWHVPMPASTTSSSAMVPAFRKEYVGSPGEDRGWHVPVSTGSAQFMSPTMNSNRDNHMRSDTAEVFLSPMDNWEATGSQRSSLEPALTSGSLRSTLSLGSLETPDNTSRNMGQPDDSGSLVLTPQGPYVERHSDQWSSSRSSKHSNASLFLTEQSESSYHGEISSWRDSTRYDPADQVSQDSRNTMLRSGSLEPSHEAQSHDADSRDSRNTMLRSGSLEPSYEAQSHDADSFPSHQLHWKSPSYETPSYHGEESSVPSQSTSYESISVNKQDAGRGTSLQSKWESYQAQSPHGEEGRSGPIQSKWVSPSYETPTYRGEDERMDSPMSNASAESRTQCSHSDADHQEAPRKVVGKLNWEFPVKESSTGRQDVDPVRESPSRMCYSEYLRADGATTQTGWTGNTRSPAAVTTQTGLTGKTGSPFGPATQTGLTRNTASDEATSQTGLTGNTGSDEATAQTGLTGNTRLSDLLQESTEQERIQLQDVFMRRKQEFIRKSQARVEKAKAKRYEVEPRVQVKGRVKPAKPVKKSGTSHNPKRK